MNDLLCEEHVHRLAALDQLVHQLASSNASQSVKFDQFCTRFDEKFSDLKTDLQGMHDTIKDHGTLLSPLVADRIKKEARSKRMIGVGLTILTAGVIGVLARFGDVIFAVLVRPRG